MNTTGKPLEHFLKWADYPDQIRQSYTAFYQRHIVPELGGHPRSSPFLSYMTDDHTPIELSYIFDAAGIPTIRFAIDPVRRQQTGGQVLEFFEDFQQLKPFMSSDTDLHWCQICIEELTITFSSPADAPTKARYPSQYFAGFDLSHDSIAMKAYFMPEAVSAVTGTSKIDLVYNVVRRVSSNSGIDSGWEKLLGFFQFLPQRLFPSIEIVAVDCVPSHRNRIKIYVRAPCASLSTIKLFMTLDGSLDTSKTLDLVSMFWNSLFPGLDDDEEPNVGEERLRHPTSGLLFYYELRPDHAIPFPKLYLPIRHLCNDENEVVNAVSKLYLSMDKPMESEKYRALFNEVLFIMKSSHQRRLDERTGLHTYVTFAAKPSRIPEVTVYFNPECVSSERGGRSSCCALKLGVEST
ncbi:aromatic prenyltransferase [Mycena floridula]|nr:aromatic prenyltransferase [Mycena floridula]